MDSCCLTCGYHHNIFCWLLRGPWNLSYVLSTDIANQWQIIDCIVESQKMTSPSDRHHTCANLCKGHSMVFPRGQTAANACLCSSRLGPKFLIQSIGLHLSCSLLFVQHHPPGACVNFCWRFLVKTDGFVKEQYWQSNQQAHLTVWVKGTKF